MYKNFVELLDANPVAGNKKVAAICAHEEHVIEAMIDARQASGLTQQQLADRTGIAQADISKLEHGNANPSLRTLQRLAAGMGMQLKVEFIPAK